MESEESQKTQESQVFTAKTVDEATSLALEKLGLKREEVEITVLKRGRTGILGLGAEDAKISVRPIPPQAESDVSGVAQEVLTKLLEAMGVLATVQPMEAPSLGLPPESSVIALDIRGDDLGILIGRRGQTLVSLQYLLNLMVSHKTKARIPIIVDVEGYKSRRYEALRSLALRLAEQVKSTRQAVTLEPMPANERRIIHMALSNHAEIVTQSIGAGESRKVVIVLKSKGPSPRYPRPPQPSPGPSSTQRQGEDNDL